MTITEFLEARIDEDWQTAVDAWCGGAKEAANRLFAECQAKRAIVEECWEKYDPGEWGDGALRHLSAVYSDRPDYREEWRP